MRNNSIDKWLTICNSRYYLEVCCQLQVAQILNKAFDLHATLILGIHFFDVLSEVWFACVAEFRPETLYERVFEESKSCFLAVLIEDIKEFRLYILQVRHHWSFTLRNKSSLSRNLLRFNHEIDCKLRALQFSKLFWNVQFHRVTMCLFFNRFFICIRRKILKCKLFNKAPELSNERFPKSIFLNLLYACFLFLIFFLILFDRFSSRHGLVSTD